MADRSSTVKFGTTTYNSTAGESPDVFTTTVAGLGTPKGILAFTLGSAGGSSGSILPQANMFIGVADNKKNACSFSCGSRDNIGTSDTQRLFDTTDSGTSPSEVAGKWRGIRNTGTLGFVADVRGADSNSGPVSDGWKIHLEDDTLGPQFYNVMFAGADLDVTVAAASMPSTDQATVQIPHQFSEKPESLLGFCFSVLDGTETTLEGWGSMSVGAFTFPKTDTSISQMSVNWQMTDGIGSGFATEGAQRFNTTRVIGHNVNSPYTLEWSGEITDVDATSVTLKTHLGSASDTGTPPDRVGFIFIKFPDDRRVWIGNTDSPTSTSQDWIPDSQPGFPTDFIFAVPTMLTSVDTDVTTDPGAVAAGFGFSDLVNANRFSVGLSYEVGRDLDPNTTNAHSLSRATHSIYLPKYTTGTEQKAFAMDEITERHDGFYYEAGNIQSADGTARDFLFVAIQKNDTFNYIYSS